MDNSKGVSIIIPTFNRSDMLRDSLTNLKLRTDYIPKEIIVVDGGSEPGHILKYKKMNKEQLFDRMILLPYRNRSTIKIHEHSGCIERTLETGTLASNPEFPYVFHGADDLLYRTNWVKVLVDMLDSDWANKNNIKVISGFNHWAKYDDYNEMTRVISEMYKSEDEQVEGYASIWAGNWFFRKDFFESIGRFTNNLKKLTVPPEYVHSYEAVMEYKFRELGYRWGATRETYVQTMAIANSSMLGNYALDENGQKLNGERHKNGIAIGVAWKNI